MYTKFAQMYQDETEYCKNLQNAYNIYIGGVYETAKQTTNKRALRNKRSRT